MDDYKIIVEQEHQTVMAHYEVVSRWDRYLGITAPMTQVPVPTAIIPTAIMSPRLPRSER